MTQTVEVEKGMEPLPCPFCGGKRGNPQNYGDTRDWRHRFVECLDCFANLYRFRDTQAEADADLNEAWNRRTHSTLTEENARLKDRVRELVTLLDNQVGTPCEQIRHADEVDRLLQENKAMREALEKFIAWIDAEPVDGRIEYAHLTQTLVPLLRHALTIHPEGE